MSDIRRAAAREAAGAHQVHHPVPLRRGRDGRTGGPDPDRSARRGRDRGLRAGPQQLLAPGLLLRVDHLRRLHRRGRARRPRRRATTQSSWTRCRTPDCRCSVRACRSRSSAPARSRSTSPASSASASPSSRCGTHGASSTASSSRSTDSRTNVASVRAVNIPPDVEALFAGKEEEMYERLTNEALAAIEEDGADVIVLGSTTMHQAAEHMAKHLPVPVVNPGPAAVAFAETLVRLEAVALEGRLPRRRGRCRTRSSSRSSAPTAARGRRRAHERPPEPARASVRPEHRRGARGPRRAHGPPGGARRGGGVLPRRLRRRRPSPRPARTSAWSAWRRWSRASVA